MTEDGTTVLALVVLLLTWVVPIGRTIALPTLLPTAVVTPGVALLLLPMVVGRGLTYQFKKASIGTCFRSSTEGEMNG